MCDCISKIDEKLKEFNTKIMLPWWSSSGILAPHIETRKLDEKKRGKPRSVIASFCPFCGDEYSAPKSAEPDVSCPQETVHE